MVELLAPTVAELVSQLMPWLTPSSPGSPLPRIITTQPTFSIKRQSTGSPSSVSYANKPVYRNGRFDSPISATTAALAATVHSLDLDTVSSPVALPDLVARSIIDAHSTLEVVPDDHLANSSDTCESDYGAEVSAVLGPGVQVAKSNWVGFKELTSQECSVLAGRLTLHEGAHIRVSHRSLRLLNVYDNQGNALFLIRTVHRFRFPSHLTYRRRDRYTIVLPGTFRFHDDEEPELYIPSQSCWHL
uniref:Uncharacterized protein n=1 Tax=Diaporthe gulyae deltaflexivirus 1 TaxID=3077422 RepID=A0AA96KD63_9VIRU|nr:MAG: hypothetical protein [Diaporthe gulyae deltaflexivirus 1]